MGDKLRISTLVERWQRFWYGEIAPIRLAAFRWALTWTLLLYVVTWLRHGPEWLSRAGFHPSAQVSAHYAPQLPLLPPWGVWPFAVVYVGAALTLVLTVGRTRLHRPCLAVVLACTIYVTQVDPISAFTLNRLFIVGYAVLLLAPEPAGEPPRQCAWPVRILQLTLVLQYFGAGVCKIAYGDWWGRHDVLWMQSQGIYMTEVAAWMARTWPMWAWAIVQNLALWFELLAPLLLAVRRLRPLGFALGLGMHLVVALTMDKLVYFSLQMACVYLLLMRDETLGRIASRFRGNDEEPASS